MKDHYPNLLFKEEKYQFTPTYDIDYAWSYKYKGVFRTLGATARDIIKNRKLFFQRFKVLTGQERDPYFTFDYLNDLHQDLDLAPIYFFLVGQRGEYDKNISIKKKSFQQLIHETSREYKIGLHPSYASNTEFLQLKKEYIDLEKTINDLKNKDLIRINREEQSYKDKISEILKNKDEFK